MKKNEKEIVMEKLYKLYEEELDTYFRYHDISLEVIDQGIEIFPFSTDEDCAIQYIEKSLQVIESNIMKCIKYGLREIYEERVREKGR